MNIAVSVLILIPYGPDTGLEREGAAEAIRNTFGKFFHTRCAEHARSDHAAATI